MIFFFVLPFFSRAISLGADSFLSLDNVSKYLCDGSVLPLDDVFKYLVVGPVSPLRYASKHPGAISFSFPFVLFLISLGTGSVLLSDDVSKHPGNGLV